MLCPSCQHVTSVVDSRRDADAGVVLRKRTCRYCGTVFNTAEKFLSTIGRAEYAKKRGLSPEPITEDSIMQEARKAAASIPSAAPAPKEGV